MESIVSLERGVRSCAELQVFSCYRGWKEACQATHVISTTWRHKLSSSGFFFPLQGKTPKEIHAILTQTLRKHAPSYATVKNWVAQFKKWWLFHLWCALSWTTQNGDHPRDYSSNSYANLGRLPDFGWINRWATGHLTWAGWVHHSWRFWCAEALHEVGPEMPEHRSKTSTVPVVWGTFGIFRHDPDDFLLWLVTMEETWLYHYDLETKQQSMEWQHSGSPHPKKFWVQKSIRNFSPQFFGIKTASSSLIIFQRAKLSTWSITHLCWCNWRTFWRRIPWEGHQGGLVLARQCPGSLDTCNPEETGLPGLPVSWSPTPFSGCGPVGLPPWTEKTMEMSPFFVWCGVHCCHGDLVGQTTFWIFFEWLAKVRATG